MGQTASRSRTRDFAELEREIIARLDVRAEYAAMGVRIVARAPTPSGWLACRAVGRDDAQPSAAINVQTGRYSDRGTGDNLSLWEFAARHGGHASWQKAREGFASKTGVDLGAASASSNGAPRESARLEFVAWNDALAQLWIAKKPGVALEALKAFGARQASYRGRRVIALPSYGESGIDAPSGWVLWDITGRPLPVMGGTTKMKSLEGSQPGLLGLPALAALGESPSVSDVTLWKVEGPTDALALWSAIPRDQRDRHWVTTNNAGTSQHPFTWLDRFAGVAQAIVVHDCDRDGQAGGRRWAEALAVHAQTRHLTLPYEITDKHGRDLRDFLAEHSFAELLTLAAAAPLVEAAAPAAPARVGESGTSELQPAGGDSDPHRLAGVFLRKLGHLHADGLALRYWREQWYTWTGRAYRHLPDADLRARITRSLKEEFDRVFFDSQADGKDVDAPEKVTRTKVSDVLQALASMCLLPADVEPPCWLGDPPAGWDASGRELLVTASGILHLGRAVEGQADCLTPLTPRLWTLNAVDYPYDPAAGLPDLWIDFLCGQWHHDDCRDLESIHLVQEWFGYCLSADTRHDKILLLVGPKRSGKGTIADTLAAMVGERNVCGPTLSGLCDRFGLQGLLGCTVAIIGDARLSNRSDTAVIVERLLSISGGDRQTIDRKNLSPLTVRLPVRFMLLTNELPNLRDASGAMASRFLVVQTNRSFFGVEDTTLKEALRSPEVLPGILNWAIEGYARLRKRGAFQQPQTSQQSITELEELTSPVRAFVADCCTLERGASIETRELFAAYVAWCKREERPPQTQAIFGRDLIAAFPQVKKTRVRSGAHRTHFHYGITLDDRFPIKNDEKTSSHF